MAAVLEVAVPVVDSESFRGEAMHRNAALVSEMVARTSRVLGDRLDSIVLYGPEVHGDAYREIEQLNLLLVLRDLEPQTLRLLGDPVSFWLKRAQPWPRLFTLDLMRDSLDVFPIEFLDITRHHRVVFGHDPFAGFVPDPTHLRIQCERELREKLMRLREGYVESRGVARTLRKLLSASFASFAPVWRGCLHLLAVEVPLHDTEVAEALCRRLELEFAPFAEIARIASGSSRADIEEAYVRYDRELTQVIARIDRWAVDREGESS
jgi:hypothetical protein